MISIIVFFTYFLSLNTDSSFPVQQEYFLLKKQIPHFRGYNLNGSSVDETFLKDKVVLLNFMFIGCRGCMQELPDLAKLEQSGFKDFVIVTIMGNGIEDIKSYQGTGDTSKVFYLIRKMFKSESINHPIITECKEVKQYGAINNIRTCTDNISKVFHISAYPTNILIDKKGIITKLYHNLSDEDQLRDLRKQLNNLTK